MLKKLIAIRKGSNAARKRWDINHKKCPSFLQERYDVECCKLKMPLYDTIDTKPRNTMCDFNKCPIRNMEPI